VTQLYRIEEMYTNGWELIHPTAKQLTKEKCKELLERYLADGHNPNYIRAVPDVQSTD
jgi:hypothetical protein